MINYEYVLPSWVGIIFCLFLLYISIARPINPNIRVGFFYFPRCILLESLVFIIVGFIVPGITINIFPPFNKVFAYLNIARLGYIYIAIGVPLTFISWALYSIFRKSEPKKLEKSDD